MLVAGSPEVTDCTYHVNMKREECRQRAMQCANQSGCQSCRYFQPKAVPSYTPEHVNSLRAQRTFNTSLGELERRLGAGESYEACRELHGKVLRDRGEAETAAGRCSGLGCGPCRAFAPRRVPPLPAAPAIDRSLSAGSTAVVQQYKQAHPGVAESTMSDIALLLLGVCIATRNGALTEDQKAFIKDLILCGQANQLAHVGFLMQVGRDNRVRPFPLPRVSLPASTEVDEWLGQQRLPDLEDTLRNALWRSGITSLGEAGQTGTVFSLKTHTATRKRVRDALGDTAKGRSAWDRLEQRLQMLTMEDMHRTRLRCINRRLECYEA